MKNYAKIGLFAVSLSLAIVGCTSAVQDEVDSLRWKVNSQEEQLDAVQSDLKTYKSETAQPLKTIESQLSVLNQDIGKLREEFMTYKSATQEFLGEKFSTYLSTSEQQLNTSLTDYKTEIEKQVGALQQEGQLLNTQWTEYKTGVDQQIGTLQQEGQLLNTQWTEYKTGVDQQIGTLQQELIQVKQDRDSLLVSLDNLSKGQQSFIQQIQQWITSSQSRITDMEDRVIKLRMKVEELIKKIP